MADLSPPLLERLCSQILKGIELKAELTDLNKDLEFDGKVEVELRFHDLDTDWIWKLQSDDLVDRELTPQTRASIKIVLGSISNLS